MDGLKRIEEHRDQTAGLEWEGVVGDIAEGILNAWLEDDGADAYDLDDPKHPGHSVHADIWDGWEAA